METGIQFGQVGLSLIITIVLMVVYNLLPEMENKWKILIAIGCGLGFGLIKIPYDGLPWTVVNLVNHLLQGFLVGASSIGLHQMQKNARKPKTNVTPDVVA